LISELKEWLEATPDMFTVWDEVGVRPIRWGQLPASTLLLPVAALPLATSPEVVCEVALMLASDAERSPPHPRWGLAVVAREGDLRIHEAVDAGAHVAECAPFTGSPAGVSVAEILETIDAQLIDIDDIDFGSTEGGASCKSPGGSCGK
jgi:hypothetical protein